MVQGKPVHLIEHGSIQGNWQQRFANELVNSILY